MNTHLVILALAIIGDAIATYLLIQRTKERPPVCPIGNSCSTVLESPYSKTCGVGNDILGIVFYTLVIAIETALFVGYAHPFLFLAETATLLAGALMSCYFVYLEWRVICAWCFWCTVSAFITWGMAILHFAL